MLKTRHIITIISLTLSLFSCKNNPSIKTNIIAEEDFVIDSNELALLESSCSIQVNLDTIKTVSQYREIKKKIFEKIKSLEKHLCFTFKLNVNKRESFVSIPYIPKPFSGYAPVPIPTHSFLVIDVADSTYASQILGNVGIFNNTPVSSLNLHIEKLYLNAPDSSRYGAKFVDFVFPNDELKYADKYLTQLVIGYLKAQRKICLSKYNKEMKNISKEEIQYLRNYNPLRFKFKAIKSYDYKNPDGTIQKRFRTS